MLLDLACELVMEESGGGRGYAGISNVSTRRSLVRNKKAMPAYFTL